MNNFMIAEINDRPSGAIAEADRNKRLEYLVEALDAVSMATEALKKLVRAEIGISPEGENGDEANIAVVRQFGRRILEATEGFGEPQPTTAPVSQEVADTDIQEIEDVEVAWPATKTTELSRTMQMKRMPRGKTEKYPIPAGNRLYSRILPAEELPPIEIDEASCLIEIEIISDNTILFNGKRVVLKGDALYAFNAFMLHRDQEAITAGMIKGHGFRIPPSRTADTSMGVTIRELSNQLSEKTEAGSVELISRHGKAARTTYSVNPAIIRTGFVRVESSFTPDAINHEVSYDKNTGEDEEVRPAAEIKTLRQGEGPVSVNRLSPRTIKRLHSRVVFTDEVPSIEMNDDTYPIQVRIISERSVAIAGKVKILDGDEIFLFNAFMMLRDREEITAGDIRELGYRQDMAGATTAELIAAIERLRDYLRVESDNGAVELISKQEGEEYDTYKVNEAGISTDVVREGCTLIVEYLEETDDGTKDEKDDGTTIVRIAKENEPLTGDKGTGIVGPKSSLARALLGAKIEETRDFMTPNGDTIKVKVIEIEQ